MIFIKSVCDDRWAFFMGLRRDEKLTGSDCWSLRAFSENFNVYLQLWIMSGPPLIPFHLTPMNLGISNWIFALSSPPILCPPLPLKGVHQKLCATFCSKLCLNFNHKLEAVLCISQFITIQPKQPMNRNLNEKCQKSCSLLNLCNFSRPPHLDLRVPVLCYICHRSLTFHTNRLHIMT